MFKPKPVCHSVSFNEAVAHMPHSATNSISQRLRPPTRIQKYLDSKGWTRRNERLGQETINDLVIRTLDEIFPLEAMGHDLTDKLDVLNKDLSSLRDIVSLRTRHTLRRTPTWVSGLSTSGDCYVTNIMLSESHALCLSWLELRQRACSEWQDF